MPIESEEELRHKIDALEAKLQDLKTNATPSESSKDHETALRIENALHPLLLLADSALPLGSFAFSAGLESFQAHSTRSKFSPSVSHFKHFLDLSLDSLAGMTLPYVHESWSLPATLLRLDNDLEASTTCAVNRRASVAQGRALISMWQRSLRASAGEKSFASASAASALDTFSEMINEVDAVTEDESSADDWHQRPHVHFPPLFGVLASALGVPLRQTLYVYLLNHAKMVLSAGIRASILGPYQSQSLLASGVLRMQLDRLVSHQLRGSAEPEHAAQSVPAIDIWSGRHELVYSRIFNS